MSFKYAMNTQQDCLQQKHVKATEGIQEGRHRKQTGTRGRQIVPGTDRGQAWRQAGRQTDRRTGRKGAEKYVWGRKGELRQAARRITRQNNTVETTPYDPQSPSLFFTVPSLSVCFMDTAREEEEEKEEEKEKGEKKGWIEAE